MDSHTDERGPQLGVYDRKNFSTTRRGEAYVHAPGLKCRRREKSRRANRLVWQRLAMAERTPERSCAKRYVYSVAYK